MGLAISRRTGTMLFSATCVAAALVLFRPWMTAPHSEPRIILWAWERPEKLDFIDPRQVGVAFLSRTLVLTGGRVVVRPRLQPLSVPPSTYLIAVARVEVDAQAPASLTGGQRAEVVAALAEMAARPGLAAIQIDFDARRSERGFYEALLRELRGKLPTAMPVSITALASWCLGDRWIADLPVDEAVPMFFRMGPGEGEVRRSSKPMLAMCRQSIGISTDETAPPLAAKRRVYVFHPRAWSVGAVEEVLQRTRTWR